MNAHSSSCPAYRPVYQKPEGKPNGLQMQRVERAVTALMQGEADAVRIYVRSGRLRIVKQSENGETV